jgi:hypothetical protein
MELTEIEHRVLMGLVEQANPTWLAQETGLEASTIESALDDVVAKAGRDELLRQAAHARERLLVIAAAALERAQVGDADEAEALLSQVVTLDGRYVPQQVAT